MTAIPPPHFKVPRLLWESLEAVLQAQGKKYVREVAKALEIDPKELVRQVFAKDTVPVILHDTATTTLECSAYVQERGVAKHTLARCPPLTWSGEGGAIQLQHQHQHPKCWMARLCRRPVQLGSEFCSHHIVSRPTVIADRTTVTVRRLQDDPTRPTLWVHEDGQAVDMAGKTLGFYDNETGGLTLFEVADGIDCTDGTDATDTLDATVTET